MLFVCLSFCFAMENIKRNTNMRMLIRGIKNKNLKVHYCASSSMQQQCDCVGAADTKRMPMQMFLFFIIVFWHITEWSGSGMTFRSAGVQVFLSMSLPHPTRLNSTQLNDYLFIIIVSLKTIYDVWWENCGHASCHVSVTHTTNSHRTFTCHMIPRACAAYVHHNGTCSHIHWRLRWSAYASVHGCMMN